jgi:hypothetical protein
MKHLCIALLSVLLAGCSHDQRPTKPSPAKSRSDGEQALRDALAHTNKSPRRK